MNGKLEAELACEEGRCIWRVLPLHPQPQWLESLSSYMTRLAEANGLQSINELAALAGIDKGRQSWRSSPDYPAAFLERIARLAGGTESSLRCTTFFHLARHFGCPTRPAALHRFFQGSFASYLRYCPGCLMDQPIPYYALLWRFLAVAGCHKHGCRFLSACGQCSAPIPLKPFFPRLARCPTCQGDVRTCQTSLMPPQARSRLNARTRDLELLLMPTQWAPEVTSALLMGNGFTLLRQRKHLTIADVAHLMERGEQVIVEMEYGNWNAAATLFDYLQYTDLLDCSLSELVEATRFARSIEQKRTTRVDELAHLVRIEEDQRRQAAW